MTRHRLILQMASATDLTGHAPQAAAETALVRALGQVDLPAVEALGLSAKDVEMRVTVAVPCAEDLDAAALAAVAGPGPVEIRTVEGGLMTLDAEGGACQISANAAVEIFVPGIGSGPSMR